MISGATTSTSRGRLYRAGWLIVVLAFGGYLLVAIAEQGTVGAGLREVPNDPLPFERHHGVGIDLSGMSSLTALEWLQQTDAGQSPMVLAPVDGDIVEAFNNPETFVAARTAVDTLVDAAGGAPFALCLRRPVSAAEERVLAEAAVTAIIEEYTDSITYISTCHGDASTTWQGNVLGILGESPSNSSSERVLAPVTIGAPIRLQAPVSSENITDRYIDGLAGASYVALSFDDHPALTETSRAEMQRLTQTRAHVALVFASPQPDANPDEFVQSLVFTDQGQTELSEGYNSVTSPLIAWQGAWIPTQVGPVSYQRSTEPGSVLSADFVGTEVWATGLVSPEGGRIGIWINATEPETSGEPDQIVDLSRTQARDASFLLIDGLPAARHRLTIVTAEGDVALSGLFVTGRPEAGWHGVMGTLGIIIAAVGGLAAVIAVAVDDLRIRIGLDRTDDEEVEHPRVFRREL